MIQNASKYNEAKISSKHLKNSFNWNWDLLCRNSIFKFLNYCQFNHLNLLKNENYCRSEMLKLSNIFFLKLIHSFISQ